MSGRNPGPPLPMKNFLPGRISFPPREMPYGQDGLIPHHALLEEMRDSYEQGQGMQNNLLTMAREPEKLRVEVANAEKRALTAAAVGNPGMVVVILGMLALAWQRFCSRGES